MSVDHAAAYECEKSFIYLSKHSTKSARQSIDKKKRRETFYADTSTWTKCQIILMSGRIEKIRVYLIVVFFYQVFSANFDNKSIVKQYLDPPIFAHYIRLHPTKWVEACALRAEFYGCYEGKYVTQSQYKYRIKSK